MSHPAGQAGILGSCVSVATARSCQLVRIHIYVGYCIADVSVFGTIVEDTGISVQTYPQWLTRHHPTYGILGMNALGDIPDIRDLLLTIKMVIMMLTQNIISREEL